MAANDLTGLAAFANSQSWRGQSSLVGQFHNRFSSLWSDAKKLLAARLRHQS
jgi:hypothetical protein